MHGKELLKDTSKPNSCRARALDQWCQSQSSPPDRCGNSVSPAYGHILRCCTDSPTRSEEHTSELQSLMRISYAVFCLKKKTILKRSNNKTTLEDVSNTSTNKPQHKS